MIHTSEKTRKNGSLIGVNRSEFPLLFESQGKLDSVLRMEYRTKLLNPKWAEAG